MATVSTSTEITALRAALLQAWEPIPAARDALKIRLRADGRAGMAAWVHGQDTPATGREMAIEALAEFFYDDDQAPTVSRKTHGLICASSGTLAAAEALNGHKQAFVAAWKALRKAIKGRTGQHRELLAAAGFARLHYRQTERQIVVLRERPVYMGFSWIHTHNVERLTQAQAYALLQRCGDDESIRRQIRLLEGLPVGEVLARVTPCLPQARVNVRFSAGGSRLIKSNLPILVTCAAGEGLPRHSRLRADSGKDEERLGRVDRRIEESPLLPAIRVYRYLPPYRERHAG